MTLFPAAVALAVVPALPLGSSQSHATLASLRHDYRPLLVFGAPQNEQVREQEKLLAEHVGELKERQVVVVPVRLGEDDSAAWKMFPAEEVVQLEPGEDAAARRRFHVGEGEFVVILIGKDGGEKLRSQTPVTMERLIKVIDAMPMRQKEARDGHTG